MKKCTNSKHKGACVEWAGMISIVMSLALCPRLLNFLLRIMQTPIGLGILSMVVLGVVARKMQVWSWERDRPFSDGVDATPDLYLFNSGDGSGFHLRAFMPDVKKYSVWYTPFLWAICQAKRKVAIVMPDGTVSFPWLPVSWVSGPAGAGSRIPVPVGYRLDEDIVLGLRRRMSGIKHPPCCTEEQKDFCSLCEEIFKAESAFDLSYLPEQEDILTDRIDLNQAVQIEQCLLNLGNRFHQWEKEKLEQAAKKQVKPQKKR